MPGRIAAGSFFKLPKMGKKTRIAAWALLLSLTVAIFLYPIRLNFGYEAIQSLYIFWNLPLFGVVYFVWFLSLLWLLLSLGGGKRDNWLRMALVGVFAVVYLGFWAVITPQGFTTDYDGGALSYVHILKERGVLATTLVNFGYFQFPFTSILGACVSQATGLGIFDTRLAFLLFNSLLLGVALYVFFKNMLGDATLASVGALLAVQGSMVFSKSVRFYPAGLGLVFFAVFLMLMFKPGRALFEATRDKIIAVVLMAAITATHYITSLYVVAILLGIYAVQLATKKKLIRPLFIIPMVAIPLLWGVFVANPLFGSMVGRSAEVAKTAVSVVANGGGAAPSAGDAGVVAPNGGTVVPTETPTLSLWWVGSMLKAYLGTQSPLWARVVTAFWVVLLFAFGTAVAFRNLFVMRRQNEAIQKVVGAMMGIIALSVIAVFVSLDIGGYQFFRFLQFGGFFVVPLVLGLLWAWRKYRKAILASLVVVLLLLSFPTFLAHNSTIEADTVYPQELSAGEFLEAEYGTGEGLCVSTDRTTRSVLLYHLPDALFLTDPEWVYVPDGGDWRQSIDKFEKDFESVTMEKVFVFSARMPWLLHHVFGVSPTDYEWSRLREKLSKYEKVYDNGFIEIYK
jgi:hypothetical protein